MFPKPEPQQIERQRKKSAERYWIRRVHEEVEIRDRGVCRACEQLNRRPDNLGLPIQMHELVYRSKTRGKPMHERFSTENCVLLCATCHRDLHNKKLSVHVTNEAKGADGKLIFKLWE